MSFIKKEKINEVYFASNINKEYYIFIIIIQIRKFKNKNNLYSRYLWYEKNFQIKIILLKITYIIILQIIILHFFIKILIFLNKLILTLYFFLFLKQKKTTSL